MKKIFFLASVISLAIISMSCKSKQNTTTSSSNTTSNTEVAEEKFRLVVSFISKGAGLDREKNTAFLAYVNGHAKKPVYKEIRHGREGETDYAFILSELTKAEQVDFVSNVNKLMAGSDMVFVKENSVAAKPRR